ncbi:MAG: CsbD family protein [Steroidobacteraceae bacterium]
MGVDKDHAKERANEVDGKIKEVTRKIVDDKKLETKGNPRRFVGDAQVKGVVKQDLKDSPE